MENYIHCSLCNRKRRAKVATKSEIESMLEIMITLNAKRKHTDVKEAAIRSVKAEKRKRSS